MFKSNAYTNSNYRTHSILDAQRLHSQISSDNNKLKPLIGDSFISDMLDSHISRRSSFSSMDTDELEDFGISERDPYEN